MGATTDDTKAVLLESLPADPYTSLHFHFGMLLGVEDFRTMAGYPQGKHQLHQSWLHGTGVVWGLAASFDSAAAEVRVAPGLAIDGLGREIPVDEAMCVNVPMWFQQRAETIETDAEADGVLRFDVHVVAKAKACLTRPVPAVADGCSDVDGVSSAYSRAVDIAHLELVPGLAPEPEGAGAFARVRLWLGLRGPRADGPGAELDQDILNRLAEVRRSGDPAQARAAYERLVREDVMALRPAANEDGLPTRYPVAEPGAVVLANIRDVRLVPMAGGGFELAPGAPAPTIDPSVRQSLLPTWLLQQAAGRSATVGSAPGPQVIPGTVTVAGNELRLETTSEIEGTTVQPGAFSVTTFDAGSGWQTIDVTGAGLDGDPRRVVATLASGPGTGVRVRVIVRGEGATPLLGVDGQPLAGAAGEGAADDRGRDYVRMLTMP